MTTIKAQTIEILQYIPDDKLVHVLEILKSLKSLYSPEETESENISMSRNALIGLKQYRGIVSADIDEKAELAKAREEKNASFS